MVKKLILVTIAVFVILTLALAGCSSSTTTSSTPASTSNPTTASEYKFTKPINIILHLGVGSSYDTYARGIAPYLAKYTGVDVLVKNVTGAAGLTGALELWRDPPDGQNIGLFDMERFVSYQMVSQMEFDVKKFEWVGIPATGYYVLGVAASSPYHSIQDLIEAGKQKPVRFITTEIGTTEVIFTAASGINSTYVINTGGGAESITAMIKGEGDMRAVTESMFAPFIQSGDVRPLMYFNDIKSTILSNLGVDCPTAVEAGFPELAYLSGPRGFVLPPGTPSNIIAAYEKAFAQAYADPELIAWGEKTNAPLVPKNRAETLKAMNGLFDLYQKYADLLKQYIQI